MPRTARRKRSLSSEEDISITYYSKHRCVDKEYSSVSDNRHFKRYSSRSRSRERRRHNRRCSRNRSHSARRSDRKSRRLKHRHDHSTVSTVRDEIPPLSKFPNNVKAMYRSNRRPKSSQGNNNGTKSITEPYS